MSFWVKYLFRLLLSFLTGFVCLLLSSSTFDAKLLLGMWHANILPESAVSLSLPTRVFLKAGLSTLMTLLWVVLFLNFYIFIF